MKIVLFNLFIQFTSLVSWTPNRTGTTGYQYMMKKKHNIYFCTINNDLRKNIFKKKNT